MQIIDFDHLTFSELLRTPEIIQALPGVYCWIYVPEINTENENKFINSLNKICDTKMILDRKGYIGEYKLEIGFGSFKNGKLFSELSSKHNDLAAISKDPDLRESLKLLIQNASIFTNILYVGKADNMRDRISDHLSGKGSTLLEDCRKNGIESFSLRVNIFYDNISSVDTLIKAKEKNLFNIAEEIVQRISIPGFVRRKG